MTKSKFFACLALTFFPNVALALSCLPPDIRESFREADASPQSYFVVEGTFTLADPDFRISQGEGGKPVPLTRIAGSVNGRSLGAKGRTAPFNQSVSYEIECVQNSCGQVLSNTKMITFVRKENDQYFVEARACGGFIFYEPGKEERTSIQQCLDGADC